MTQHAKYLLGFLLLLLCLSTFTHAATVGGYTLDLLLGSNYTNGLTAAESSPVFASNIEYQLLYFDKRNSDLYYSVGNNVIRKLDKNGIVTNVAGTTRNSGYFESIYSLQDYYYALDRELSNIGGLVIDPNSNDIYYLNSGTFLERIRNSDKKSIIVAGQPASSEYPVEGLGNQIYLDYTTYVSYVRGLAINSKNEIYILQRSIISKYNIGNYSVSTVLGTFEPGTYTQIVLSKDETVLYAKNNDAVYNITVNGGIVNFVTQISGLMSIETANNELYMLTQTGVYVYRNNVQVLIAAGNSGSFQDGMNSTNLLLSYATTMMISDNGDIFLSDKYNFAMLKIDNASKLVTNLVPYNSGSTVYSAKNFTSRGVSLAVQNLVTGSVYFRDPDWKNYVFDGNLVTTILPNTNCIDIAINSLGEVYYIVNYYIYQLLSNGSSVVYAGDGSYGTPENGTLITQNPVNPSHIGFFSNNDMFIQQSYDVFRVDRNTKLVTKIFVHPITSIQKIIVNPANDHLFITEGNSITELYPNGTYVVVAGYYQQLARSINQRKTRMAKLLEEDGESAFAYSINPTGLSIGVDGYLYISYGYRVRKLQDGLLWTQSLVDSQQGPMNANYITDVSILGRFNDSIMLTNTGGNILILKPAYTFTCFGISPSSSSVCSGSGSCTGPNRCTCESTNFGFECQYSTCNDVSGFNYQTVCGGIGTCSKYDQCTCPYGYTGFTCSTSLFYSCYGISSNSTSVCSGKGTCVSSDSCTCNAGRVGNNCQYDFCASTWNADSQTISCAAQSSSTVEVNQEVVSVSQLNSKVLKFSRNPSISITFPSDFYTYVLKTYPEITDQSQLTAVSSIYDPTLDTSKELLVVSPITSISLYKNTSETLSIYNLPNPIVIQYNSIKIDKSTGAFNYSCMYYDTASSSWSSGGIKSTITSSELSSTYYVFSIKCETYHLTSFSVIDMNYKKSNRDDTLSLSGLTTGGIIALAVSLGATCLICVVIGIVIAAIVGICFWTKQKKKKMSET